MYTYYFHIYQIEQINCILGLLNSGTKERMGVRVLVYVSEYV